MPIKYFFLLLAIGFGLGSFYKGSQPSRKPSSEHVHPSAKSKPALWAHSLTGKLNQAISVRITAVAGIPESEDQELTLKAEVTLNRPIDGDLKFQWVLPSDTSLVSGELEDVWPNLLPGQTATTEISVLGVSKEDVSKTVTLHVSGSSNGVQYATAGSFAPDFAERIDENQASGFMKAQNADLALKKNRSAEKLERVHQ